MIYLKKTIDVVAALIVKDEKVLIAKRSTGDKNALGKWEFPGGKVDPGESERHAIEREIKEELDLEINAKEFIINNVYEYPTHIVNLKLYRCEFISGDMHLHDHSDYQFVDLEELLDFDLAPADIPIAKHVQKMNFTCKFH